MSSLSTRFFVIALCFSACVSLAQPSAVQASDMGDWGWYDVGTYSDWSDVGAYDNWSDVGTYDDWYDVGTYDIWSDVGTYSDWYDVGTYDDWYDVGQYGSYDDDPVDDWYDVGQYGHYSDDVTGTFYDDVAGTYYDDVAGTYYDDAYGRYYDDSYGRFGGGSYSTPSCYSCSGGGFGGGFSFGGVTPITISIPSRPQTPVFSGGGSVVNNNTNINNNSAVAIAQVIPAAPQYPVVYQAPAPSCTINHALAGGYYGSTNMAYLSWSSQNATTAHLTNLGTVAVSGSQTVYPTVTTTYVLTVYNAQGQAANCSTTVVVNQVPPPVYNNQYCTIYANPTTIQNGQSAVLSWTSTGATSAWLSDGIGSVAVNGSLTVRPESSRVYTLTVYGPMGTKTCSTTLNVQGTYVSLTQIPYTGFDLGPIGNAMYWFGLMTFAVAGAYLTLYYRGGMARLAYALVPSVPKRTFTPVAFKKESPTLEKSVPTNVQPIVNSIRKTNTVDSMAIVQPTDGSMPKIVITRN